ncbi:hypothetical protein [Campylobacter sp. RM12651]|uniref:hypothetical protein n=1 Tax=Campylobacter sp. RM12651 TaxID=1660079 RepID=UPI001EFBF420|nr:hypothetical protein [Campylobacter sp. RM12651]ULO03520.1 hypothetical protein AVBRAN_1062 [Campylobacter sp. RM12651]
MNYTLIQAINNSENEVISYLNNLKELDILYKEILFLRSNIYTNPNIYYKFKKIIMNNIVIINPKYKEFFNLYFLISNINIENIEYIRIELGNRFLHLLLLSELGKNHELIQKYITKYLINFDEKLIYLFRQYLCSKNISFSEIDSILQNKNKKGNLSIALMVSGQIRGIELAVQSWIKKLGLEDNNMEIDVYISTWDISYRPNSIDFSRIGNQTIINNLNLELSKFINDKEKLHYLKQYLPPLRITKSYLYKVFSKIENINNIYIDIEDEKLFSNFTNSMKMYYKINRCFNQISKQYDLYLRIRPDLYIENTKIDLFDIYEDILNMPKIYTCYPYVYEYYGFGVDDKLAISNYTLMNTYCNCWNLSKNKHSLIGHRDLAEKLFENKIQVKAISEIKTIFVNYNLLNKD